jgi:Phage integrase family.
MPIYKTDEKRDGLFKYRVVINYTDHNGKYKSIERSVYGSTEAKQLEAKLKTDYKDAPVTSRLTVAELTEEYLNSLKHDVRATSHKKTSDILNSVVIPTLGNVRIDKLNSTTLQKWKNQMSEKDNTIQTKKSYYKYFRAMLNYGVKMEYMSRNPLLIVGNFKDTTFEKPQEKMQYYTADQFIKYITAAKKSVKSFSDWAFYVFFNIAFYTGMRKGEINALKWTDIEGDIIHVRRSIAQKLKGDDIETPPKNKTSYRDLQIPIPLKNVLDEHKERQKNIPGFSEDNRVCGGPACLRDTTLDHKNRQYATAADLPRIRIHDFRHSHASLLCNEGINIQEIARRLGHAKIEITWNTYSHLYPREDERAMKILNAIKIDGQP